MNIDDAIKSRLEKKNNGFVLKIILKSFRPRTENS